MYVDMYFYCLSFATDSEIFKMLSNNIVIAASFGRKVATEQFWKQKFDTFERSERCREFEMNY